MAKKRILEGAADGFQAFLEGDPDTVDRRALRIATMAEYEAISVYEQMAELVKSPKVKKVLLDIAQEEKVHVGEFESLLKEFDDEHGPSIDDGEKEVGDMSESFISKINSITL